MYLPEIETGLSRRFKVFYADTYQPNNGVYKYRAFNILLSSTMSDDEMIGAAMTLEEWDDLITTLQFARHEYMKLRASDDKVE